MKPGSNFGPIGYFFQNFPFLNILWCGYQSQIQDSGGDYYGFTVPQISGLPSGRSMVPNLFYAPSAGSQHNHEAFPYSACILDWTGDNIGWTVTSSVGGTVAVGSVNRSGSGPTAYNWRTVTFTGVVAAGAALSLSSAANPLGGPASCDKVRLYRDNAGVDKALLDAGEYTTLEYRAANKTLYSGRLHDWWGVTNCGLTVDFLSPFGFSPSYGREMIISDWPSATDIGWARYDPGGTVVTGFVMRVPFEAIGQIWRELGFKEIHINHPSMWSPEFDAAMAARLHSTLPDDVLVVAAEEDNENWNFQFQRGWKYCGTLATDLGLVCYGHGGATTSDPHAVNWAGSAWKFWHFVDVLVAEFGVNRVATGVAVQDVESLAAEYYPNSFWYAASGFVFDQKPYQLDGGPKAGKTVQTLLDDHALASGNVSRIYGAPYFYMMSPDGSVTYQGGQESALASLGFATHTDAQITTLYKKYIDTNCIPPLARSLAIVAAMWPSRRVVWAAYEGGMDQQIFSASAAPERARNDAYNASEAGTAIYHYWHENVAKYLYSLCHYTDVAALYGLEKYSGLTTRSNLMNYWHSTGNARGVSLAAARAAA